MNHFAVISLLAVLMPAGSDAFPGYEVDAPNLRRLAESSEGAAKCPMNKAGADLEAANVDAAQRIAQWEADYPIETHGRRYFPGVANEGEVYCDGSKDSQFCNKIHGPWGDSIPQDTTYCLWGMLEFQDPAGGTDYAQFESIFDRVLQSLIAMESLPDAILKIAACPGLSDPTLGFEEADSETIPWYISSVIWKDGNKYAKDWIEQIHRIQAQIPGYDLGFTFRGHYKAVKCDEIMPALAENGITEESFDPTTGGYALSPGLFKQWWNTFSDLEDKSPEFSPNACVAECTVGPCSDDLDDYGEPGSGSCATSTVVVGSLFLAMVAAFV